MAFNFMGIELKFRAIYYTCLCVRERERVRLCVCVLSLIEAFLNFHCCI